MSPLFVAPRARTTASGNGGHALVRRAEQTCGHRGEFRVTTMRQMHGWRATLLAFVALTVVVGTALSVMTGAGALLHVVHPERQFDAYAVLHNQIALLCLIGLSVLWLLAPHSWAKELVEVLIRNDPAAQFPSPVTDAVRVRVISVYDGRAPPPLAPAA